jgi:hypothetical protein
MSINYLSILYKMHYLGFEDVSNVSTYYEIFLGLNSLLFASCTDTVKLLEAWRGVLSSTPPYK